MSERRYDVEYYIKFAHQRIDATVNFESSRYGVDRKELMSEVLIEARKDQENYDDSHGTSGFMRWFNILVSRIAKRMKENPPKMSKFEKAIDEQASKGIYVENVAKHIQESSREHLNLRIVDAPVDRRKRGRWAKPGDTEKQCADAPRGCGQVKPLEAFGKVSVNPDGKSHICKDCISKKYGPNGTNTGNSTKKVKESTITESKSDYSFSNDDLDDMILMTEHKLEIANTELVAAQYEVTRLMNLVEKLKRRKK